MGASLEKQKVLKMYLTEILKFQGLKGEAGSKGVMGLFGTRGPVGQKVSTVSTSVKASPARTDV